MIHSSPDTDTHVALGHFLPHLGCEILPSFLASGNQCDGGAVFGEEAGGGGADATSRTCYEGGGAGQIRCHRPFFSVVFG
jgi:hypothetical protein